MGGIGGANGDGGETGHVVTTGAASEAKLLALRYPSGATPSAVHT